MEDKEVSAELLKIRKNLEQLNKNLKILFDCLLGNNDEEDEGKNPPEDNEGIELDKEHKFIKSQENTIKEKDFIKPKAYIG